HPHLAHMPRNTPSTIAIKKMPIRPPDTAAEKRVNSPMSSHTPSNNSRGGRATDITCTSRVGSGISYELMLTVNAAGTPSLVMPESTRIDPSTNSDTWVG